MRLAFVYICIERKKIVFAYEKEKSACSLSLSIYFFINIMLIAVGVRIKIEILNELNLTMNKPTSLFSFFFKEKD